MKLFFTLILLLLFVFSFAQNSFKVQDGGSVKQVIQLKDSSYVCVGTNKQLSGPNAYISLVLLHISPRGKYISGLTLGGSLFLDEGSGYAVTQTTDGGFAICGEYQSNLLLLKFSNAVLLQWQKTFPFSGQGFVGTNLLQLKNKDFLIGGNLGSFFDGGNKGYLLNTDSTGNIKWSKSYFNYPTSFTSVSSAKFNDVAEDKDGFICVGTTASQLTDTTYLIKLNSTGDIIWSKCLNSSFKNNGSSLPKSIAVSSDYSSYIVAGTRVAKFTVNQTDSVLTQQLFVTKTDTSGNVLWSKTNAPDSSYRNFSLTRIKNDHDGGYICLGTMRDVTNDFLTAYNAAYLIKVNSQGTLQWTRTIDEYITSNPFIGVLYSYYVPLNVYDIIPPNDSGFCLPGDYLRSEGSLTYYVYHLYKLNPSLQLCNGVVSSYGALADASEATVSALVSALPYYMDTLNSPVTLTSGSYDTVLCDGNTVLPVHLLSFTASLQNNTSVAVEWKTTNEINLDYFIVQRSTTADTFKDLKQVKASGSSNGIKTYSFTDSTPLNGTSYYRLEQVDKDGRIVYSPVVSIATGSKVTVVIAPNPVQNSFNVQLQSNNSGKATIQIVDISGKVIVTHMVVLIKGENNISITAAQLAKGIYLLKIIEANGEVKLLKFIKE